MTHNTTYSDESVHVRACSEIIRAHTVRVRVRTTSAWDQRHCFQLCWSKIRFAASAAQPGIWRRAADQHRHANSCATRGAPRASIVGITDTGSVLEGAASQAHLSPTHGAPERHASFIRAAHGPTQKKGVNSRSVILGAFDGDPCQSRTPFTQGSSVKFYIVIFT